VLMNSMNYTNEAAGKKMIDDLDQLIWDIDKQIKFWSLNSAL
jgi:hypothetical protein